MRNLSKQEKESLDAMIRYLVHHPHLLDELVLAYAERAEKEPFILSKRYLFDRFLSLFPVCVAAIIFAHIMLSVTDLLF